VITLGQIKVITLTYETENFWSLLRGGCCSEVALCYENLNLDTKIMVALAFQRWSFKLRCDSRFQRVFTACSRVFKVITLIGNQDYLGLIQSR